MLFGSVSEVVILHIEPWNIDLLNWSPIPVAQRKRRKTHRWLRHLAVFLLLPVFLWGVAFAVWFFWYDISGRVTGWLPPQNSAQPQARPSAAPTASQSSSADSKPRAPEKIREDERQRLEEIIKKR